VSLLRQFVCAKKFQSQNVTREKLCKALSYEKFVSKMMMKLTIVFIGLDPVVLWLHLFFKIDICPISLLFKLINPTA